MTLKINLRAILQDVATPPGPAPDCFQFGQFEKWSKAYDSYISCRIVQESLTLLGALPCIGTMELDLKTGQVQVSL